METVIAERLEKINEHLGVQVVMRPKRGNDPRLERLYTLESIAEALQAIAEAVEKIGKTAVVDVDGEPKKTKG